MPFKTNQRSLFPQITLKLIQPSLVTSSIQPLNVNVTVNSDEDQMKGRWVRVGLVTFLREVDEWSQTLERCTHGLCNAKRNLMKTVQLPLQNATRLTNRGLEKTNADKHL